jgi:hypothetical protein
MLDEHHSRILFPLLVLHVGAVEHPESGCADLHLVALEVVNLPDASTLDDSMFNAHGVPPFFFR